MSSKQDWREYRDRQQAKRRAHTHTCVSCGLHDGYKIWDTDKNCPRCGAENPDYREKGS